MMVDGNYRAMGRASQYLTGVLAIAALFFVICSTPVYAQGPIRSVAQCFASKGNPFISMQCGPYGHLSVRSALHGRHAENRSDCEALPQDCVEDQMQSFYDWQDCMGRSRCFMSVQQAWMPACGNYSQFLQAEYSCTPARALTDICIKGRYNVKEGFLRSPDYPDHYPHSRDCECTLTPSGTDHLFISFLDLSLEMREDEKKAECADWLLLEAGESGNNAKRTDLNCGEVNWNTKNITVKGNTFKFSFHSDRNDRRQQAFRFNTQKKLKGFWVYFRAEPMGSNITMTCGPSKPKLLRKLRPSPTRKPSYGDFYLDGGAAAQQGTATSVVLANILAGLVLGLLR